MLQYTKFSLESKTRICLVLVQYSVKKKMILFTQNDKRSENIEILDSVLINDDIQEDRYVK